MRARWLAWALLAAVGCGAEDSGVTTPVSEETHLAEVESWRAEPFERLRRPDGWLSLVGLFWLEEGASTLGADPASDLLLPAGKAAASVGVLHRADRRVRFEAAPEAAVSLAGEPVADITMVADLTGEPTVLEHRGLRFHVIERGDRVGLRVKDLESAARRDFAGIEHFPVDPAWRLEARFEPFAEVEMIPVPNITGDVLDQPSHGRIVFTLDGAEHSLRPLGPPDDELFVVFGDATNGDETYGGGRFLDVEPPDAGGRLVVDFNKAYNPPCVFTPYATCPLPPPGNRLPLAVPAGEKSFAAAHEAGVEG